MTTERYGNINQFCKAVSESELNELRFMGSTDYGLFEFDSDRGTFSLPANKTLSSVCLNGMVDKSGRSVFSDKTIWIDGDAQRGCINYKGMFSQMNVQIVEGGIRFDVLDIDASYMFNGTNFVSEYPLRIVRGRLGAKEMFRGCVGKKELIFNLVSFYDITRMVADSSITELTFQFCSLACSKHEFEMNTESCMYENGKVETINFISCDDRFVEAVIEHINKYGADDDIVININD